MQKISKEEFLKRLQEDTNSPEEQLQVLQYFINNYPVEIDIKHPFFNKVIGRTWTQLQGITLEMGFEDKIRANFLKLQKRVEEIKQFN